MQQSKAMVSSKHFVNYVAKPHDSLHHICAKFHSTPYRMRQLNPLVNLDEIKQGQTLLVEINSLGQKSSLKTEESESPSPFK
jgi:hypothetical protein